MDAKTNENAGKCPVMHGGNTETGKSVMEWWPNALNLDILAPPQLPAKAWLNKGRGFCPTRSSSSSSVSQSSFSLNAWSIQ